MSVFLLNAPQVVFIHIPKTGGSSIRHGAFASEYQGPCHGHIPSEWQDAFAFAFVRDPIERFMSAFRHTTLGASQEGGLQSQFAPSEFSLDQFAEIAMDETISHEATTGGEQNIRYHTLPMTHPYNCLEHADFVGRFECLSEDYARLAGYLGLSPTLPTLRSTAHHLSGQSRSLPNALRNKLLAYYADDYAFLGKELDQHNRLPEKKLQYRAARILARSRALDKDPTGDPPSDLPPVRLDMPIEGPVELSWRGGASLLSGAPALIYHAPGNMMQALLDGNFMIHSALAGHAVNQGLRVFAVKASAKSRALVDEDPRHLHVYLDNFPDYKRNVFHSIPSYLRGFWYFDELAPRNNSTIRLSRFDRRAVYPPYATKVMTRLKYLLVEQNVSKFSQRERGSVEIEQDCLVFYAQNFFDPHLYPDYLRQQDMIEAAIKAKGRRRLYIKPHPIQKDESLDWIYSLHDPANGVEITQASVHDLNAAAAVTISLTSACAFEGFLQRTPAILGGQSDFHHNAITLTNAAKMGDAIEAALAYDWPFAQYVTWYLKQQCVEDRPSSLPIILDRIHRKGFTWADHAETGFLQPLKP